MCACYVENSGKEGRRVKTPCPFRMINFKTCQSFTRFYTPSKMIRIIDVKTHRSIHYSVIRILLFETCGVHTLHVVVIDITYCDAFHIRYLEYCEYIDIDINKRRVFISENKSQEIMQF